MSIEQTNTLQPQKLWTKDFTLATTVNFIISLVFYLLMPTMALYAVEKFGSSDTISGLATSAFIFGAIFSRAFAGKFLDLIGRRRLLLTCLAIYILAAACYVFADSALTLILLRIVHGFGFGASSTVVTAAVMGRIPAHRKAEGTGYFGISTTLATACGPLIAIVLIDAHGYDDLFFFTALVSVVAFVIALFIDYAERTVSQAELDNKWNFALSSFIDRRTLPLASIMLLGGFAYSSVLSFLTSFAKSEGFTSAAASFFLVYAVGVLVARLFIGRIQDRHGDNVVIYPILVSFIISFVILGFAQSDLHVLISAAFAAFGFGALMPAVQAVVIGSAPAHMVGLATSTFYLTLDLGTGIGPIVLGMFIPMLGYQGMYLAMAVLCLAIVPLYYYVHGRHLRASR